MGYINKYLKITIRQKELVGRIPSRWSIIQEAMHSNMHSFDEI